MDISAIAALSAANLLCQEQEMKRRHAEELAKYDRQLQELFEEAKRKKALEALEAIEDQELGK